MDSQASTAGPRYWLLNGEAPSGPFDVAQIHAQLAAGEINWQTRACPVGGSTWLPLLQVPGLGPAALPAPPVASPAASRAASTSPDVLPATWPANPSVYREANPVTSPLLPPLGNALCIYTLVVNPILFGIGVLSCCLSGPSVRPESAYYGWNLFLLLATTLLGLAVLLLLLAGGWRLRAQGLPGKSLVQTGLGVSIVFSALTLAATSLLAILVFSQEDDPFVESSTANDVIGFVVLVMSLTAWAFEVVAFVWLVRVPGLAAGQPYPSVATTEGQRTTAGTATPALPGVPTAPAPDEDSSTSSGWGGTLMALALGVAALARVMKGCDAQTAKPTVVRPPAQTSPNQWK